ncbi:MAG TPA: hypothetical protein VL123_05980 [Candidatus Udaeobacter sp.]|jgi:hypothetical protein|nr:hypothetical protein [Candidatus Udaeobacter sp.]
MSRRLRALPLLLLIASLTPLLVRPAATVPLFAARTGLMCGTCHFDPNGGGPRNEYGFSFARNRHSLEADPDTLSPWHDLNIVNRIGENTPLYFGVNQRFMLITNSTVKKDSLDRLGFFNMENAIHLAFQPHRRLTLVYSFDAFSEGPSNSVRNKEGFGLISGFPADAYIKVGRFRVPFGLRQDDHTVATRNGFLDFSTQTGFLPYDSRYPDMGVEVGADHSGIFGRIAMTNGEADVLSGQYAGAKAIKLGYNSSWYQGAVSFYDDYRKESFSGVQRATRWGYYGLTHYGPVVALGEVAAGTDELEPIVPGMASGPKTNLLAGYAELDVSPRRAWNARVRWDHLVTDRSSDPTVRAAATHERYSIEAEWVPVPFAELRAAVRRIDHKDETAYGFDDETQSFLQVHFAF